MEIRKNYAWEKRIRYLIVTLAMICAFVFRFIETESFNVLGIKVMVGITGSLFCVHALSMVISRYMIRIIYIVYMCALVIYAASGLYDAVNDGGISVVFILRMLLFLSALVSVLIGLTQREEWHIRKNIVCLLTSSVIAILELVVYVVFACAEGTEIFVSNLLLNICLEWMVLFVIFVLPIEEQVSTDRMEKLKSRIIPSRRSLFMEVVGGIGELALCILFVGMMWPLYADEEMGLLGVFGEVVLESGEFEYAKNVAYTGKNIELIIASLSIIVFLALYVLLWILWEKIWFYARFTWRRMLIRSIIAIGTIGIMGVCLIKLPLILSWSKIIMMKPNGVGYWMMMGSCIVLLLCVIIAMFAKKSFEFQEEKICD